MLKATPGRRDAEPLRAFSKGGSVNIHQVHVDAGLPRRTKHRNTAPWPAYLDALDFMETAGLTSEKNHELASVDFYTSHEALLLEYEEALTRMDSIGNGWLGVT